MDKISTVSSQSVLVVPSFSTNICSKLFTPLVNSFVKNRLFKTAPDIDDPPFQFIDTMDLSVVDTMLHDSPDLVIETTEISAVWRPQIGQDSLAFLDAAVQLLHVRGVTVHCPAGTQSRYQALCVSAANYR